MLTSPRLSPSPKSKPKSNKKMGKTNLAFGLLTLKMSLSDSDRSSWKNLESCPIHDSERRCEESRLEGPGNDN